MTKTLTPNQLELLTLIADGKPFRHLRGIDRTLEACKAKHAIRFTANGFEVTELGRGILSRALSARLTKLLSGAQ